MVDAATPLLTALRARVDLPERPELRDLVEAVRAIPYGRPSRRDPQGVVDDWRGTCSTKHALLAGLVEEAGLPHRVELVHRVYRVDRRRAAELFGPEASGLVPEEGLVDVHRYARVDGLPIDVTFPSADPWDGRSPMRLACGDGDDHPAGADPDAEKRALEERHCDPEVREPFIAALGLSR